MIKEQEDGVTNLDFDVDKDLDIDVDKDPEKPRVSSRKIRRYEEDIQSALNETKIKQGILKARKFPSYCLQRGFGCGNNLQHDGEETVRSYHRKRLRRLLNKLMKRHHWDEASGVLSVLLQMELKDKSVGRNRLKYSAALELLNRIKGETIRSERGSNFYDLWLKKIGVMKTWSPKNKFAVRLESVIFSLQHGLANGIQYEQLKNLSTTRMENFNFEDYPLSDLVKGLMLYHLWYSDIPRKFQLTKLDSHENYIQSPGTSMQSPGISIQSPDISMQSEIPRDDMHVSFRSSRENDVHGEEASNCSTSMKIDSYPSVDNLKKDTSHSSFEVRDSDKHSSQGDEHNGDQLFSNHSGDFPHASIFDTRGLPPWLLPLKVTDSYENLVDEKGFYELALKHLHDAFYSTPPVTEAFHPLIQMLLLGDRVPKALDVLENISHSSATVLQLRLKATVLEHFDVGNYVKLSKCYEDILKKDSTCSDSLSKLVDMYRRGEYDIQNLTEMLALHLDVTSGMIDTWKELASCLLKISQCESDRLSTCYNASKPNCPEDLDYSNKIPELFTYSDYDWKLRCKVWMSRHFRNDIFLSDIASGDLELLTYKASTAALIYGRHFQYVSKTTECLQKEDKQDLHSILQTHVNKSFGFYPL